MIVTTSATGLPDLFTLSQQLARLIDTLDGPAFPAGRSQSDSAQPNPPTAAPPGFPTDRARFNAAWWALAEHHPRVSRADKERCWRQWRRRRAAVSS